MQRVVPTRARLVVEHPARTHGRAELLGDDRPDAVLDGLGGLGGEVRVVLRGASRGLNRHLRCDRDHLLPRLGLWREPSTRDRGRADDPARCEGRQLAAVDRL